MSLCPRRGRLAALLAPVLLAGAAGHAAPVAYTDFAAFLADLPASPGFLDFDSVATGTRIPTGDALPDDAGNSLAFDYDIYGFDLMVRADYDTTSPPNYLGLSDEDNFGLFISGDGFTVTFSRPVLAVGAYFLLGEDLVDDEVRITAGGATASNLAGSEQTLPEGDRAYFVGLIATQPFTTAQFASESAMGEDFPFLFNVDDIVSAIGEEPAGSVWIGGASGSWGEASNWSGGVPDAPGAAAAILGDANLTLNAQRTVGSLAASATDAVLLSGGPADTLSLDNAALPALLRASAGTLVIAVPVHAAGDLTLDVAADASLRLLNPFTSAGGVITKTGQGPASFALAIDLAGGRLVVEQGELEAAGIGGGALQLAAGTVVRFAEDAAGSYSLSELALAGSAGAWAAQLDLAGATLVVDGGSDPDAVLSRLLDQAASGRAGGAWTGQGIASSVLAATDQPLTLAVYAAGAQVILHPALIGDLSFDGRIDGADYLMLDQVFLAGVTGKGFFGGDFDLDGDFDADDYYLVDQAFLWQMSEGDPPITAVPEPACGLVLLGAALAGFCRRRR